MKEINMQEEDQWIPWEIAYSLREATRNDRTSRTNAMLALVIPDENNEYDYVYRHYDCCLGGCTILTTGNLFEILKNNMFNIKKPDTFSCDQLPNTSLYRGHPSYINVVRWTDFLSNINNHLDVAFQINDNIKDYELQKSVIKQQSYWP